MVVVIEISSREKGGEREKERGKGGKSYITAKHREILKLKMAARLHVQAGFVF